MSGKTNNEKVIIVSTHDSLYPIRGGGALRTLGVARELQKRGRHILLIAPAGGISELEGMPVISIAEPRKQRSQILSTVKFALRLLAAMAGHLSRAEAVFMHNTIAAPLMPFLAKLHGFRFVLDITDIHAEYLTVGRRNVFEKVLTPCLLSYEYFIIRCADSVIVATEAMKKALCARRVDPAKIEVVYDSVERRDLPREKDPGAELGIIHLGAIDRQHGVEILVRAIPEVLRDFPQARFFFIGGGRELPAAKRLASATGISQACVFTDWLPCEEARRYLRKACIGIIPRQDVFANRIITTLKIFEYWASATAVIASALEGIREIAYNNENVLMFSPGSSGDLAEKIILLLRDARLRSGLTARGLEAVVAYDAQKAAGRIAENIFKA
ncbi:MAG: glycosyltransferase [Candidatus Omnitrophica bacterium]|nr:glycosyltransferase [Candidatus Omnitrophota bacterium]